MLQIEHLKKSFGDRAVLQDVSFTVPEHSIFGFIGQNGAGKTTTMKLILGLLAADGGSITIDSIPVRFGQAQPCIGYLPDVPEFYNFMTPAEYLRFCGEISGMEAGAIRRRTGELLELVGLAEEKRRIKGFSRGMKQRLGIAQALLHRPRLLICDEPTSALDPIGRKEILDVLIAAKEETTILFSTHILSDVERICDEIACLHKGIISFQGRLADMREHRPSGSFAVETESGDAAQQLLRQFPSATALEATRVLFDGRAPEQHEVLAYLGSRKLPVLKVERLEPTLEALFLEVVQK